MAKRKQTSRPSEKLFADDQRDLFEKSYEERLQEEKNKSVECLGMTFENDEKRREYFMEKLRKKLKDPEFRKIEGFPIGEDEDILALSDPPYYTSCPNPWITDFIKHYGKPYDPNVPYSREPFAADVSEGKSDPIYNAHSYHTKVPHKAILRYILHYTEPGDIVFDGFCGTGMTGVAAQLCGDKATVESLGVTKESPEQKYKVENDGTILERQINEEGKATWVPFSKLGYRYTVIGELSPIATFISSNYNLHFDVKLFEQACSGLLKEADRQLHELYTTLHTDGKTKCEIEYVVWSELFLCPECSNEIVFYDTALNHKTKKVKPSFNCPYCDSVLDKKKLKKLYEQVFDHLTSVTFKREKRKQVAISYLFNGRRMEKKPTDYDRKLLKRLEEKPSKTLLPHNRMMNKPVHIKKWGDKWRAGTASFTQVNHLFLCRPSLVANTLWLLASKWPDKNFRNPLLFFVEQAIQGITILNRHHVIGRANVNQWLTGVYYVPSLFEETSYKRILQGKLKRLVKTFEAFSKTKNSVIISTSSANDSSLPSNTVDYIFTDPPFGDNLAYSELNFVLESFHKVFTSQKDEAVISKSQSKSLHEYYDLMRNSFIEYYRILKPGRWITVEFSNTKAAVWNSIQNALADAGFIIANVSALDKQQGSFNALNNITSVKQDLIISAYKPNGGFEKRFLSEATTKEGVWDFVRTHLKYLPVIKCQGGLLQMMPERDPRILFDQMVAFFVRKGYPVPVSSQEFQIGLAQRFIERDGMYFLPDQVAEYDRKKMLRGGKQIQQSLFVSDEASAIEWLRNLIRQKPQTFQDINPLFMKEIGGWQKHEKAIELSEMLEQNFLRYDGKGEVPSQIHSYLSSNFKELRNLAKDDPLLKAKAKNRWYVPDPNKAGDLEKLRERALMREFEEYRESKQKRLKVFRLEAVRAGFKKAWQERDYATIIAVARKIPEKILQEDPKLLMWYDQALTRMGGE